MTSTANQNAEVADEATELDLLRALARAASAFKDKPGQSTVEALYRATGAYSESLMPPLRTAAERDRDLADLVRATIHKRGFDPDAFWAAARKLDVEPVRAEPFTCDRCGAPNGARVRCKRCGAPPFDATATPELDLADPCGCEQTDALQSKLDETLVHLEQRNAELNQAIKRIRHALPHLKHRGCCTQNVYVAKAIAVLEGKP